MAGSPPEGVSLLKKGLKSVFHRKGRSSDGHARSPSGQEAGSRSTPIEAPTGSSAKMPQLTTPIPGSSLGPETHNAGIDYEEEQNKKTEVPVQPLTNRASYAEGMSATSGPLGSSLEEVEMFERRSSIKSGDGAASEAGAQVVAEDKSTVKPSAASGEAADVVPATSEASTLPGGTTGGTAAPAQADQPKQDS